MKSWFPVLAILALALNLCAQPTNLVAPFKIGTGDADKYYDHGMIVTGNVAQVTIRPNVVFLNLDKPFPNSPFTLVIFPDATNQFGDIKSLSGKNVEASGIIKKYNDKPEIILEGTNQLKVIVPVVTTNDTVPF